MFIIIYPPKFLVKRLKHKKVYFFIQGGGTDAAVPNFSGFLLRPSYYAPLSKLSEGVQKVSHNVPAVYDVWAAP
jgi:hypothetical protein